jgi:high-affinity K+ transport system ATPase subunit B
MDMHQPASAAIAHLSIAPFNAFIIESVPESVRGVQFKTNEKR